MSIDSELKGKHFCVQEVSCALYSDVDSWGPLGLCLLGSPISIAYRSFSKKLCENQFMFTESPGAEEFEHLNLLLSWKA